MIRDSRWYALWTRSRHEASVRRHLEQIEVEAFLPTVRKWSRWKDRKKEVDWPLFPGYCFARFDPSATSRVVKSPGIVDVLSIDGAPAPIPEAEIQSLRQLVESELKYDPCPLLKEGMMVEVIYGPLQGVTGRLMRKGTRARLFLAVNLINQAVSVEVDAADVRPFS